jgi:hypothetical protein
LSAILLIGLRTLPRVSNEVFEGSHSRVKTHELMLILEKVDEVFKVFFEKFLRRLKVFILKLDNVVTRKINKYKNERLRERNSFVLEKEEKQNGEEEGTLK